MQLDGLKEDIFEFVEELPRNHYHMWSIWFMATQDPSFVGKSYINILWSISLLHILYIRPKKRCLFALFRPTQKIGK